MPQLAINQGPQDALLYDNTRSYFTNVGYVRTSNFQVEYRNVECQNTPAFGSTINFVIPKAADLLGPCDLRLTIPAPNAISGTDNTAKQVDADNEFAYAAWVDKLGFAMLEKITFSIGSNDIEVLDGDILDIKNELMTSDEMRLGFDHILKTGEAANPAAIANGIGSNGAQFTAAQFPGNNNRASADSGGTKAYNKDWTRLIQMSANTAAVGSGTSSTVKHIISDARTLTVPLGLFFTKHVSQYFPLAAIAGCNDVRIAVKLRPLKELLQVGGHCASGTVDMMPSFAELKAELLCHYVHVTAPEAQELMNKEHVRLLNLWQHEPHTVSAISGNKIDLNLSFLHPVSMLVITVRKEAEVGNSEVPKIEGDFVAAGQYADKKGRFFYHGDGSNPNYDDKFNQHPGTIQIESIQCTLNGQERHPGLSKGIPVDYLRSRLMPMLHSNSSMKEAQLAASMANSPTDHSDVATLTKLQKELNGNPNIFVMPFSLNPEGSNPAGAVNMSKVSHAKLTLNLHEEPSGTTSWLSGLKGTVAGNYNATTGKSGYIVDVYACYYNWLQIKNGRALLSFA